MRNALAVLLMIVFSLPLIAPALASSPDESSLPACCRRNGRHHCAMSGMALGTVDSRYTVLSERCPYSPFARVTLMAPHVFASPRGISFMRAAGPTAVVRDAEAGYRISADRTRRKRGPPLLAL